MQKQQIIPTETKENSLSTKRKLKPSKRKLRLQKKLSNLIKHNSKHLNHRLKKQFHKFVLIPGVIDIHHLDMKNAEKSFELLLFGNDIIKLINCNKKWGGYCCPMPIYLNLKSTMIPDIYNNIKNNIPKYNSLSTYAQTIIDISTDNIEFHISSHGCSNSLRVINPFWGAYTMNPFAFAGNMHELFVEYQLETHLKTKNSVIFQFHCCNSAYCYIGSKMSENEIYKAVQQNTFIGKFCGAMNKFGYNNLIVIGYRGNYDIIKRSGKSCVVVKSKKNSKLIEGEDGQFTIYSNGKVIIPKKYSFDVKLSYSP